MPLQGMRPESYSSSIRHGQTIEASQVPTTDECVKKTWCVHGAAEILKSCRLEPVA